MSGIKIDGSMGHGGGQVMRTAVSMSAVTGKSVTIKNIRAKRSKPGLRPQHLKGVEAVAKLCDAEVQGAKLGSTELEFKPGKLKPRRLKVDTGTAGSISLVLQSLLLPCFFAPGPVKARIIGGTDVRWSPPIDFLLHVTLPLLSKMGCNAEIEVEKRGYYPKGGGIVHASFKPGRLESPKLTEKGEVISVNGVSSASKSLEGAKVAERQATAARKKVFDGMGLNASIETSYSEALCPGSCMVLWLETENTVLGASALGERGKPAEEVGREAATGLAEQNSQGTVDEWSSDQIIPFIALAGGEFRPHRITEHCKTNMRVCEMFTGKSFIVKEDIIKT